ncbi:DUF3667 domain-containing protein [bacterium]|nr:DUF3667 domain-containing protein [bacterium]
MSPANKTKRQRSATTTFRDFLHGFSRGIFHVDSRTLRTMSELFIKPGHLTRRFFLKDPYPYVHPLKLYLAVNLLFFLLTPVLNTPNFRVFQFSAESLTDNHPLNTCLFEKELQRNQVPESIYMERLNAVP